MNVGVVYRPPNSNFNDFLSELRGIIKTLPKTVTYLMGDFNLDLHKNESSSNVEAFEEFFISEGLEENYDSLIGDDPSNPTNFSTFFEKYKEYLDDTCKLAVPKKTVRNIINNPWITDSIISAIDKKDYFYSNWKSTCTKKDPDGDRSIHKIFSDYRRILKHIISDEKSKYHNKKFVNASGDPKKT